jgi:hypothetical protein
VFQSPALVGLQGMPDHFRRSNRQRRYDRPFRPSLQESGLEPRRLLSAGMTSPGGHGPGQVAASLARVAHPLARNAHTLASQHARRLTPSQEINAQFASFLADFVVVEEQYVQSIVSGSSSTITVSATLTSSYTYPSTQMQVDNAAVFGANGVFTTPVNASASLGGVPVGATYVLTGRSGNTLIVNTATSSNSNLVQGATLTASVQSTSQSSAASIFPSYIINRTQQMAMSLVTYFNSLPLKLPYYNAPPHTPNQRGAIQNFVYGQVAGHGLTVSSLQQSLLAVLLPTTAGSDLTIYNAAVASAVELSRQAVLDGVSQIYSGRLQISAPAPANRLGTIENTSTSSSTTTNSTPIIP